MCHNVTRFIVDDDDDEGQSDHTSHVGDPDAEEEGLGDDEDAIEDPDECSVIRPASADGAGKRVHIYDYSVVYSSTYQVPVLFFQAGHLGAFCAMHLLSEAGADRFVVVQMDEC